MTFVTPNERESDNTASSSSLPTERQIERVELSSGLAEPLLVTKPPPPPACRRRRTPEPFRTSSPFWDNGSKYGDYPLMDQNAPRHRRRRRQRGHPVLNRFFGQRGGGGVERGGDGGGRILDREGRFHQSRGRWSVRPLLGSRSSNGSHGRNRHSHEDDERDNGGSARGCWDDWFHSLAYTPTLLLCFWLMLTYLIAIILYAVVYWTVSIFGNQIWTHFVYLTHDRDTNTADHQSGGADTDGYCNLEITSHMEALYFSLSTMATLGYGVSDYYFGDCWTPFLLVLSQVFVAMIFDAVAIGLIFQRLSRGQKRSRTIVFTDTAVVRRVRGIDYFMFRIGELRRQHIIEARVRLYCIRHERCLSYPQTYYDQRPTIIPDHRRPTDHEFTPTSSSAGLQNHFTNNKADVSSNTEQPNTPLQKQPHRRRHHPRRHHNIETTHYQIRQCRLLNPDDDLGGYVLMGLPHIVVHKMEDPIASPLVPPRPLWYDANGMEHSSSLFTTDDSTDDAQHQCADVNINHSDKNSSNIALTANKQKTSSTGASTLASAQTLNQQQQQRMEERIVMRRFLRDRDAELIVLVEGVDEITGHAVQARHSYRWDDITWDATFVPCVFPLVEEGTQENDEIDNVDSESIEQEEQGDDDLDSEYDVLRREEEDEENPHEDSDIVEEEESSPERSNSNESFSTRDTLLSLLPLCSWRLSKQNCSRHRHDDDDEEEYNANEEDDDISSIPASIATYRHSVFAMGGGGGSRTSSNNTGNSSYGGAVCVVDFNKFHDTMPAPLDCDACPHVHN